jgi:arylsulfatase A-like enzyme
LDVIANLLQVDASQRGAGLVSQKAVSERKRRPLPLAMLIAFATLFFSHAAQAADAAKPNVVVIFCDDLGYADIGPFGAEGYATPNLDRMAAEGRKFTNFYVVQAVCSASRTGLLTGCYPNRVGILGALGPASKHGIAADETTLGEVAKQAGYATAAFGKWHLGHHPQFLPTRHGFDEYFGLPYSNDMWPKHPTAKFPDLPLIDGERTVELNPDQTQLTTWYTERAVKFIDAHREHPFLLYVPHSMPHVPLYVSDKFAGKTERGLFGDVISEIDWSVGEILAALRRNGLDDRTLVVFTSDNGPWLSYGNHAGSAKPLAYGKGTAWDGGVRVPCVMRWPGKIPAGTTCDEPAMTIDVLPTVAKLLGVTLDSSRPIDGLDIAGLMTGGPEAKSPHDALYFYWGEALHAIRAGKWKLHFPHPYIHVVTPGAEGRPGKLNQQKTELALYDLEADSGELQNVADRHPQVVAELQKLADRARTDLGDTLQKRRGAGVRKAGKLAE